MNYHPRTPATFCTRTFSAVFIPSSFYCTYLPFTRNTSVSGIGGALGTENRYRMESSLKYRASCLCSSPCFFAGYFGVYDTSQEVDLAVNATALYSAHSHALSLVSFPQSPTVYSLIAFLIVQNLLVREEEAVSACSFIGIALRFS